MNALSRTVCMVVTIVFLMILWMVFPGFSLADNEPASSGELASSDLAEGSLEVSEPATSGKTDLVPENIEESSKNSGKGKDKKPDEPDPDKALEPEELLATTTSTSTGGGEEGGVYSTPTAVDQVYTGAAVYNIPIVVPPGRKGVQPNLALTYNSYTSNGWVGVGWDFEIGSIGRSTKRGMDYSANDYVSSQAGELVARNDWGANYYGAKVEGVFSKYYYNSSTLGWEVTAKDGTKYYYGSAAASRRTNTLGTSKWCLDKVQDTNGNYMTITYVKMDGQIYPAQIDYTGNAGLSTNKSVVFTLEDRNDEVISYETKSEVVTTKRLQKISTYANSTLAKEYELTYENNEINGRSRLISVQEKGSGGETTIQSTNFTWYEGGAYDYDLFYYTTPLINGSGNPLNRGKPIFGDINGDGNQDIVRLYYSQEIMNGYIPIIVINCQILISKPWISDGYFEELFSLQLTYTRTDNFPYNYNVLLGDVNGDGFDDLVYPELGLYSGSGPYQVLLTNSNGIGFPAVNTGISTMANGDPLMLCDINGDGKADLIRVDDTYTYTYFGNGGATLFDSPIVDSIGQIDAEVILIDVNGDGMTDISENYNEIYLSNGNGTFSEAISSPFEHNDDYRHCGDINGDGLPDLLINQDLPTSAYDLYFADGKGSFVFKNTLMFDDGYILTNIADINGDGLSDLIGHFLYVPWYYSFVIHYSNGDGTFYKVETPAEAASSYWIDVNGDKMADYIKNTNQLSVSIVQSDGPADHLKTVTNPLGGTTSVAYSKSTLYPDNNIPYVVNPVSGIVTDDGTMVSQTQYSYSGGMYDYESREFWGFENITKTNPDGSKEQTWYHQDPYLKGRPYRVEVKDPSETVLRETDFTWTTYPTTPSTYSFAKLYQKRTEHENNSSLYTQETNTYDDTNGNLLSTVVTGTNAEAITSTKTYINKGNWVWRLEQESITGSTSGLSRQVTNTYETNTGNLLSTESYNDGGINPVVYMTYDSFGNISTVTDAEGNTTSTTYDASYTFPETITLPTTSGVSHVTSQTWDSRFGKVLTSTGQNGFDTDYTYDGYGRLTQVDYPDGGQVLYTFYDTATPNRYVRKQVKENASSYVDSYAYYDGLGRVIRTEADGESGKTIVTRSLYDSMGRNYRTEGPLFLGDTQYPYSEVVSYDFLSRPLTVRSPIDSSTVANVYYSYSGFTTTVTDADGGVKTQTKDHLGRIIEVEEQNGSTYTTTYEYNAAGDLIEITDDVGNITSFTYDTLGRKTAMNDPDMGYWQYTYDGNGNLLTQTDAKNQVIAFTYDELNRVTSKTYSPSNPMVYYFYDSGTNGIGLPYQVGNANATTIYNSYDSMGRSTSVTKTISGDSARTTQTTYDLSGKVVRTTYPDGYYVTNAYIPGTNLVGSVTGSDGEVYASISDYTPTGKMGTLIHGNGTTTTYTYNPYTTHVTDIVTTNGTTLQSKHYTYFDSGDIDSVTDSVAGVTYNYNYDDLHRLTNETNTGGFGAMQVTYNAIGNITQKTVGPNTFYMGYDSSHKHAVDYVTYNSTNYDYTYDANGNMTQGYDFSNLANIQVRTITYNVDNMPTSIYHGSGTTSALLYDGSGARAKKTVSGGSSSTTYYVGNHFEVKDGTAVKYVFAGNLRVAQIEGGTLLYFHKDHLGSSTVMTDDTGSLVESTNYEPFGGQRAHTGVDTSAYKFTDQEFDAESGLYNYDARMYDPIIGRFISPDNVIPDQYNPQSLNRYSYCLNNPLIYTDPTGHVYWGGVLPEYCPTCGTPSGNFFEWFNNSSSQAMSSAIAGFYGCGIGSYYGNYNSSRDAYIFNMLTRFLGFFAASAEAAGTGSKGVNLFQKGTEDYSIAEGYLKNREDDGKFVVMGHGTKRGMKSPSNLYMSAKQLQYRMGDWMAGTEVELLVCYGALTIAQDLANLLNVTVWAVDRPIIYGDDGKAYYSIDGSNTPDFDTPVEWIPFEPKTETED